MRSVSFVKCFEFSFEGNIYQNALTLGDVDNDGNNELMIAIGVGDVLNCGSNVLVVVSGDGWCHIFLCLSSQSGDKSGTFTERPFKLEPVHVQRIPANTKVLLIGDIDNDGYFELVLGLTDRVVRSYRWTQNFTGGRLVCLNKWECANQIGNLTLNYEANYQPSLLISQPGATFMRITCQTDLTDNSDKMIVDYHPLMCEQMRNINISSEIIGNLSMGNIEKSDSDMKSGMPYAVATLDGTLMLIKNEEIIWCIHLDQQLFALSKMDVTGDGNEELIVCSWEGYTYILDQNKHAIRFQTEEPVSGFCTGLYRFSFTAVPVPCFIYVTFNNKILIYYDINFSDTIVKNLLQSIDENTENEVCKLFKENTAHCESVEKRKFINWCFYGNHNLR